MCMYIVHVAVIIKQADGRKNKQTNKMKVK